jgi:YhgE/Pip-like protein
VSSFLYSLGHWAFRRRVAIGLTWLTVLAVLGGLAAVGGSEFDESFSLPGTESQTDLDSLSRTFPQASGTTAQVVVVAPLSGVVSTPVSAPAVDGASYSDIATTTLLVVLALWLGGLAAYVVLRPVTHRVLTSMRPSWALALTGLAPAGVIAVVQAVVLSVVLHRLLDLSAGQTAALVPYAMLIGLTFVAVNHALVAWLGGAGRFVSVVVVVVAVAGGLTSAVPGFFDALAPYLPLTPALQGLRTVVGEGDGAASAAGLLLGWLLLAVSASVLAVTRRRMLPAGLGESAITLTT